MERFAAWRSVSSVGNPRWTNTRWGLGSISDLLSTTEELATDPNHHRARSGQRLAARSLAVAELLHRS